MTELKQGQVWRKSGPCDWLQIRHFALPDMPSHDGGAPGVFVTVRTHKSGSRFTNKDWFYPAKNCADFLQQMEERFWYPAEPGVKLTDNMRLSK